MARCKRCKKWRPFLRVDERGFCERCFLEVSHEEAQLRRRIEAEALEERAAAARKAKEEREAAERKAKLEAEQREAEQRARIAEERAQARAIAEQSFLKTIESIPNFNISVASDAAPKRTVTEVSEITFSNITKRTPRDKLGDFVSIDVETTGLSVSSAEIIEIAAIRFIDYQPEEKFTTFTLPKKSISSEITAINGITDSMVAGAPQFSYIVESLQTFIGKSNIVGHNLKFDLKFIVKNGFELSRYKRKYYDTLSIAQRTLKKPRQKWDRELECYEINYDSDYDVDNYKLPTLCAYYKIPYFGAHRALADCYVTGLLLKKLELDRR